MEIYESEQRNKHKNSVALEKIFQLIRQLSLSGHTLAQCRLPDGGDASVKVGMRGIMAQLNTRSDIIKGYNIHNDIY